MAWWIKAVYFTGCDLAFLFGVINGFLGSYLSMDEKVDMSIVCLILIPVAFFVSWLSAHNMDSTRRSTTQTQVEIIQALDRPSIDDFRTPRLDSTTIAQRWVQGRLSGITIIDWVPVISQAINDERIVCGTAVAQSGELYGYQVRLTRDNEVILSQSSVWRGEFDRIST